MDSYKPPLYLWQHCLYVSLPVTLHMLRHGLYSFGDDTVVSKERVSIHIFLSQGTCLITLMYSLSKIRQNLDKLEVFGVMMMLAFSESNVACKTETVNFFVSLILFPCYPLIFKQGIQIQSWKVYFDFQKLEMRKRFIGNWITY